MGWLDACVSLAPVLSFLLWFALVIFLLSIITDIPITGIPCLRPSSPSRSALVAFPTSIVPGLLYLWPAAVVFPSPTVVDIPYLVSIIASVPVVASVPVLLLLPRFPILLEIYVSNSVTVPNSVTKIRR